MDKKTGFIHDYFDGQIVKEDSDKYKLFKIILTSVVSAIAIFCFMAGICNAAELVLIELGMIWNFYIKLNNKLSLVFCVAVAILFAVIACNFKLYANVLVYVAFYIPFQLFATTKEYYNGDFVQVRKSLSDVYEIVFIVMAVFISVVFYMFDLAAGTTFMILDALSAGSLVVAAVLRNERYNNYYPFRIVALCASIILWINVALEFCDYGVLIVALMYVSYLIFDIVNMIVQKATYLNQYMLAVENYNRIENEKVVEQKLKSYKKSKK